MLDTKIVLGVVGLTTMAYIYNRVKDKDSNIYSKHDDNVIKQYLINEKGSKYYKATKDKSSKEEKPYLWIHNSYDANSRHWKSFNERKSNDLNQPYIELCMKSIIDKCSESFNICLISDSSFKKILPELSFNIDKTPEPIKTHYRELALMKIVQRYGGMVVPSSFIAFRNLNFLYSMELKNSEMFCFEFPNEGLTSDYERLLPSTLILGAKRYSRVLENIIHRLEEFLAEDHTAEYDILGRVRHQLMMAQENGELSVLSGTKIGTRDANNLPVNIEKLFSTEFLQLSSDALGLYVPKDKILSRTAYEWFARLSVKQIYDSEIFLCRLLFLTQGEIYERQQQQLCKDFK